MANFYTYFGGGRTGALGFDEHDSWEKKQQQMYEINDRI